MKKCLLLFLISIHLIAQEMPISESNYFVYDKYNYGITLNNVTQQLFQQSNGELICSEYSGFYYKINNTSLNRALPDSKIRNPILQGYFKLKDGTEYYCGNHEIIIAKHKKIVKKVQINSQNDFSINFGLLNDSLYFLTNYKNGKLIVRKFEGTKTHNLIELKKDNQRLNSQLFITDKINIIEFEDHSVTISKFEKNKKTLQKKYITFDPTFTINFFEDFNNFSGFSKGKSNLFYCQNGNLKYFKFDSFNITSIFSNYYQKNGNHTKSLYEITSDGIKNLFNTSVNSSPFTLFKNGVTNSFYAGTNTNFIRYFPHIKKYPRLFNNTNSSSVFSLIQADDGKIWTGSYKGALSIIDDEKSKESSIKELMFMNSGLAYKDKVLIFAESDKGALLFSDINNYQKIVDNATFFYAYQSKNKTLYLGSSGQGLWFTDISNLDKPEPIEWNIVNEKQGLKLYNILTICEDKFKNIWMGRGAQGIAVYNPETKKAKTWLIENNEIDFGSICSVLDDKKTLWFGKKDGGLCFYGGKDKNDFDVKNFKSIQHPLLKNDLGITFMQQWKDYLILGSNDKILLFDLKEWYQHKKVRVRYLNAQETNFSTPTEQNTCLVDKRDESIWFATSDMVYQWDIKKWLTLPTFKVFPSIIIKKDNIETEFGTNKKIEFSSSQNSFDIRVNYFTKDNMPRFINSVLVKKGESPKFGTPNLDSIFRFSNLSAGDYVFYVQVCQQDGSFDNFKYPISIDSFLWQKWWFWVVISLFPITFIIYYFKNENEIEKSKKKLSQLNLSSLSNQFRPHFMLNVLNSIGSQLRDKPHAEKVISRLGESINILYMFTQKNKFTISIDDEIKLVENSIEIQQMLFIPELKFTITNKNLIPPDYSVPVGILQIPVENALLHGLRHKTNGDCQLLIDFYSKKDTYLITITDNGVGREKSNKINKIKGNGNGLKTVYEMIKIINQHQKNAIFFDIIDLVNPSGTIVKITLNKNIEYEKIKV